VTDLRGWMERRTPVAPMSLDQWVAASDGDPGHELTELGYRALERARTNPGRVRESAFDLLAADALLSYACEAALEAEDPADALRCLLLRVAEAE
jgi:protein involved in temperature-dependent protein secretion